MSDFIFWTVLERCNC